MTDPSPAAVLDGVFASSGLALCLVDPEGRVRRANAPWLEAVRCAAGDVAGRDVWELVPDAPTALRALHARARAGEVVEIPPHRLLVGGRERWYAGRLSPVPFASGTGVLITAWDVTAASRHKALVELGKAEAELRSANERLREADRRKDEFLAMLSHELRNPLAPIRNSVAILAHASVGGAQAARAREVIARQVEHLTRLVDDLLDVTRIARGKIALRREPIDLAAVVRRTAEDHRPLFLDRGLSLGVEVPAPVWLLGDRTRLTQVVGNLLQNAAKFTGTGGRVMVALTAAEGEAELRVSDTGAGIAPDLLVRMFEPFVQGDQSLARTAGGLGLGLALVRGIAELHGGSVTAESPGPGGGATFVVRLPTAPEVVAASGA